MSNSTNDKPKFKGEGFDNRIKITGTLKTLSPLHIGSGKEEEKTVERKGEKRKKIDTYIVKDFKGKPIIPGSALQGSLYSWLDQVIRSINKKDTNNLYKLHSNELNRSYRAIKDEEFNKELENIIKELEKDGRMLTDKEKKEEYLKLKKKKILENYGWLGTMFGTTYHEGKLEFWDAKCISNPSSNSIPNWDDKDDNKKNWLLDWKPNEYTYRLMSVAIDPKTGTAGKHLLYDFEVVPEGIEFKVEICGQNLSPLEIGLLLFGLEGFNSDIYPLTLGAMATRGFGRFEWNLTKIEELKSDKISDWIKNLMDKNEAGYNALEDITGKKDEFIQKAKEAFFKALEDNQNDQRN